MFRVLLSLAKSFIALAPAAQADEFPLRKPGLWEIATSLGDAAPQIARYCIDAETEARMRAVGEGHMAGFCSRRDVQRSGDLVTTDSVCRVGPSLVTSHAVTTLTGDAAYSTVTTFHYDPPTQTGVADTKTSQEAKWLGPCGADMQPGDMMIQGQKFHLPEMMEGEHH